MVYGILFFLLIGITLEVSNKAMGMARITLGSVVNGISGSIDQMVYSTWKGINYIRSKAKTAGNFQSAAQQLVRTRQTECSKYWSDTLTQVQRDAWTTYASGLPTSGAAPGDIITKGKGPWSGFTAFMRNNQLAFSAAESAMGVFIAAAPIGIPAPDAPILDVPVWNTPNIDLTWAEGVVVGTQARIWARRSDGKYFHPQIASPAIAAGGVGQLSGLAGKEGKQVTFLLALGRYDFQMDIVSAEGQVSPPSTLYRDIVVD